MNDIGKAQKHSHPSKQLRYSLKTNELIVLLVSPSNFYSSIVEVLILEVAFDINHRKATSVSESDVSILDL